MKNSKKSIQINETIAIIVGITATMPIVVIPGTRFSAFSIILPVFTIYNFGLVIMEKTVKFYRKSISSSLVLWLIFALISSLFGYFYYSIPDMSSWQRTVSSYIPKIIFYLILAISLKNKETIGKALLKGLFYGAVVNCAVSAVDAFCYYGLGFSLINRLFRYYINTHQGLLSGRYNMISLAFDGVIRSGGLNYDPAHIGMLAPMLMIYGVSRRKALLVLLSVLSIIASLSTTALLCSLIGIIIVLVIQKRKISLKISKKVITWFGVFAVLIAIVLARFSPYISRGVGNLVNRVSNIYLNGGTSGNIRISYLVNAPVAISHQGLKMLTGTGFNTASEGYIAGISELSFILKNTKPFDMENTYLAYLFDLGFLGFVIYLILLGRIGKAAIKRMQNSCSDTNAMMFAGIMATIMCGLFYHYTLFSCQLLIFISTSILLERNNSEKLYNPLDEWES